jgi:CRISPR-associated exonuclease Cas4
VYTEDDLLPLSALEHLVFCERQCALIHLEQLWAESRATVEGHHLHERADDAGTEVRGDVRIARGLLLRSLRLGLSGKADVVEFHRARNEPEVAPASSPFAIALPGVTGRWVPFPVEYKRGRMRRERAYEVQLCAQALCLEEMLNVSIPGGALFYGMSARREDVVIGPDLRAETEAAAHRLHELFRLRVTPVAEYSKKCKLCSMLNVCMPKATGAHHSVHDYVAHALDGADMP